MIGGDGAPNLQDGTLPVMGESLLQRIKASPSSLNANFRLYRNMNALYDTFSALAESAGAFGPIIVQPRIQVIGHSQLPQDALPVSRNLLFTGAEDGQWVEVEGIVHRVIDNGLTGPPAGAKFFRLMEY